MPYKLKICSLENCDARNTKNQDLTFHEIPDNPTIRKIWLDIIFKKGIFDKESFNSSTSNYICSRHFNQRCISYDYKMSKILLPGSVPTILDDFVTPKENLFGDSKGKNYNLNKGELPSRFMENECLNDLENYEEKMKKFSKDGSHEAIVKLNNDYIKKDPLIAKFYYNRAISYLHLENLDLALVDIDICLDLKPWFIHALQIKEKINFLNGNVSDEEDALKMDYETTKKIYTLKERIQVLETKAENFEKEAEELKKINSILNLNIQRNTEQLRKRNRRDTSSSEDSQNADEQTKKRPRIVNCVTNTLTNGVREEIFKIQEINEFFDKNNKEMLTIRRLNILKNPSIELTWPNVDIYSASNFLLLFCRGASINFWRNPDEPIEMIYQLGVFIQENINEKNVIQKFRDDNKDNKKVGYHKEWFKHILFNNKIYDLNRKRTLSRVLRNAFNLDRKLYEYQTKSAEIKAIKSKKNKTGLSESYERIQIKAKAKDIKRLNIALNGIINGFAIALGKKNMLPKQKIGKNSTLFEKYCKEQNFDVDLPIKVPNLIGKRGDLYEHFKNTAKDSEMVKVDTQWDQTIKFIKDHWNYVFYLEEDKLDATEQEIAYVNKVLKKAKLEFAKLISPPI